jgi:VanZ family protein
LIVTRFALRLRGVVDRFRPFFFWLWVGGLIALAPLSLLPQTTPPTAIAGIELSLDKVFHFIAYGGLAGLAMLVFDRDRRRCYALGIVLVAALAYEIGQLWVPNRSFGWDDLAANTGGYVAGLLLGRLIRRRPPALPAPQPA